MDSEAKARTYRGSTTASSRCLCGAWLYGWQWNIRSIRNTFSTV